MRLILVFALVLALTASVLSDGAFFGKQTVEARPTIPSQRAVLKFDGKEQIMLVESTLDGPEGIYGWVIPLPAKPTYLKPVSPTYVTASFQTIKPPITEPRPFPILVLLLALGYVALILTSGIRHKDSPVGSRILFFAVEGLAPLILAVVFWPAIMRSEATEVAATAGPTEMAKGDVKVDDFGTIGSYQVSVVSGRDGKPILEWLKERNLAIADNALPVVEAYAREGWSFMAAEVRKKESGSYPPHPIKAVFPTDKLVYPMRLTGLQSKPLRLELLVVADEEAAVPGMEKWASGNSPIEVYVDLASAQDRDIYTDWETGRYAMAKRGDSWTYLRADLAPVQMKEDFYFDWKPLERYRAEVYDAEGATSVALGKFSLALVVAALLVGFALACRTRMATRMLAVGSALVFLAAAGYAGYWISSVHIVESEEISIDPNLVH